MEQLPHRGHGAGKRKTGSRRSALAEIDSTELAHLAVDIIADRMGANTIMLDIRPVSLLGDFFVVTSGDSDRQIKAIVEGVKLQVKKDLRKLPLRVEGTASSGWVLMDYGSVIVHIFSPAMRDYYQLEALWSDAPVVVKVQ
jgi:ribosome-associated protein